MPTLRLTDQAVRSLRPDTRQVDYWDVNPKNFGVRISPAGRKTFVVRYRNAGRYRRMSLGVYPTVTLADARGHARQVLGEVASDEDPAQVRQDARRAPSFEALAALYLEKHARVRKRSWRQDRRVIENELLPKWRTSRASEIRRRDVRELVEAIAERPAPIAANRVRALISKIFNFGISREMVEFNPCAQLERPARERQRDRVLTDTEIRTFWTALGSRAAPDRGGFPPPLGHRATGRGGAQHALGERRPRHSMVDSAGIGRQERSAAPSSAQRSRG